MAKTARSARGTIVDFDLLAIKQHLTSKPISVSVNQRRKFIDERDGGKSQVNYITSPAPLPAALSIAVESAGISASITDTPAPTTDSKKATK